MSTPRAIAVLTAALRDLIHEAVNSPVDGRVNVTTLTPDRANANKEPGARINLFLYHAAPDPAWRNKTSPHALRGDPTVHNVAPLALNLYYLLTAYGNEDDDVEAHRVLGEAMAILHDQPVLDRDHILNASKGEYEGTGLDRQLDKVRFTFQPLSLDDTFKIWSGFQCPYRMSVAYEASVVLIDSRLEEFHARPVLRRGAGDGGAMLHGAMPPRLDAIRFPVRFKTGRRDVSPSVVEIRPSDAKETPDELVLIGANLVGAAISVRFRPFVGKGFIDRPAIARPDGLHVLLTADPPARLPAGAIPMVPLTESESDEPKEQWHPGFYAVTVIVDSIAPGPGNIASAATRMFSNALAVPVAPRIVPKAPKSHGDTLTLACGIDPNVLPEQRVTAILGSRTAIAAPRKETVRVVEFVFNYPEKERQEEPVLLRVRVDEVENLSMSVKPDQKTGSPVLVFDQNEVKLR